MAHVYPYPVIQQYIGTVELPSPLFFVAWPHEWYQGGKCVEWLRQLKGWTRSDNFQMQVEVLGLTQEKIADISNSHDRLVEQHEREWDIDARTRWANFVARYMRHMRRQSGRV